MKALLVLFAILTGSLAAQDFSFEFQDPRSMAYLRKWFDRGVEDEAKTDILGSLLIIHWRGRGYQISGVDGIHERPRVEAFLRAFYAARPPERSSQVENVILAGNEWAIGDYELDQTLKQLSKTHSFEVYRSGGWAFTKAKLSPEPPHRLARIQKAFAESEPVKGTAQPQGAIQNP
jgi:hypothetical protein